jgi:hypothetical protein
MASALEPAWSPASEMRSRELAAAVLAAWKAACPTIRRRTTTSELATTSSLLSLGQLGYHHARERTVALGGVLMGSLSGLHQ